jgi:hypothetical protein
MRVGGALCLIVAVGACRAQVAAQGDGPIVDLEPVEDLAVTEPPDAAPPPDLTPPPPQCPDGSAEICGNGCDDDGNGYIDGDDPACTAQVVATFEAGSSALTRLALDPLRPAVLDGHAVPQGAHGAYAPHVAWIAFDDATRLLRRIDQAAGGMVSDYSPAYATRDVCLFNGEVIVVDPSGLLHRLDLDGKTERGQVTLGSPTTVLLSACATDGKYLYVATHSVTGMPTQFVVLDASYKTVATAVPLPSALLDQGYDRCLDFAWTQVHGFYGLFAVSGGELRDTKLRAQQVTPFAFDGGVGPPIDAGLLHGLGEMIP